jgi:hypothetical protein
MKITEEWQRSVFPHGPLQLVAPGVWQVTGSSPRGPVPRNMVIGILGDGTLWLHSVIALDEKTMDELEQLGRPSVMVVPNPIHRMDARIYKNRFPDLKVLCPSAARAKVEQVVPVDDTCERALGQYGVECQTPQGLKPFELAYLFPTAEGPVLVVTDALMNISPIPGWQGRVMGWIGSTGFFGITAIGKLLLLKDKKKFGQWLLSLASIPRLRAIAVAHGETIKHNPNEHLRQAASRLMLTAFLFASASFGNWSDLAKRQTSRETSAKHENLGYEPRIPPFC